MGDDILKVLFKTLRLNFFDGAVCLYDACKHSVN